MNDKSNYRAVVNKAAKKVRTVETPLGSIIYEIERKSVKRLNLRVRRDGSVRLSVPWSTSFAYADEFVAENAGFVLGAIGKFAQKNAFKADHTFYLGKRTDIEIRVTGKNGGMLKENGVLTLFVPSEELKGDESALKKSLELWQRERAKELLPWALKLAYGRFSAVGLKVPYPALSLRLMKSRWGSCAAYKNKITLNVRLVEKPFVCMEEVACHELAHFLVQDHSANFYGVMDIVMPEHREVNRILKG